MTSSARALRSAFVVAVDRMTADHDGQVAAPGQAMTDGAGLGPARSRDGHGPPLTVAPSEPVPGVIVVRVAGEIDAATAPRLEAVLAQAVTATAAESARLVPRSRPPASAGPEVVCDLHDVGFMSAAGITVLLQATVDAGEHGVVLTLHAPSRAVRRPLDLTGVTDRLAFTPDPAATA